MAQTAQFGVCDLPKGPGTLPGHLMTSLGERAFGRSQTLKGRRLRQPAA
jgi:hypothetical protein